MISRFNEREIKEFGRKVDELHARFPTLNDDLLAEKFLAENRARLNRREPNSARVVTTMVMARWRKNIDSKAAADT